MRCPNCNEELENKKFCMNCEAKNPYYHEGETENEEFEEQSFVNKENESPEETDQEFERIGSYTNRKKNGENKEEKLKQDTVEEASPDKFYDFLMKINSAFEPLMDKVGKIGIVAFFLLAAFSSLLLYFLVPQAKALGGLMIVIGFVPLLIIIWLGIVMQRLLFKAACKKHFTCNISNQKMNSAIILSTILSMILNYLLGTKLLIGILIGLVTSYFTVGLLLDELPRENYKEIGIKYLVFNWIFTIAVAILFAILAFMLVYLVFQGSTDVLNQIPYNLPLN